MAASEQDLIRKVLEILAARAYKLAKAKIPSKTLQTALRIIFEPPRAVLYLPHYWAVYVHDGRGIVTPKTKVWLVWFTRPSDDPRLAGGYPVRGRDVRRLTRAQWREGLRENRQRAAEGREPFMVVTKVSGPSRGVPFFEKIKAADVASAALISRLLEAYVLDGVTSETDTATLRF